MDAPSRRPWRGRGGARGRRLGRLAIVAAVLLAFFPAARAQTPDGDEPHGPTVAAPFVIVVDYQAVLRESEALAGINAHVAGLRAALQQEFGRIEEELRTFEQQLLDDRETLSEEEFVARRRAFEQRVTEAQREAQMRRQELDRIYDEAVGQVRVALLQVIFEIASDVGANMVLNKNQVILVDRSLDFTEEALAELDEALPAANFEGLPFFGPGAVGPLEPPDDR